MKISNSLKIATFNKKLWLKTMLAKTLFLAIFIGIVYGAASMIIEPILKSNQLKELISAFRTVISDYVLMDDAQISAHAGIIKEATTSLLLFVKSMLSNIIWTGVVLVVLYQVFKFIFAMFDYVIGININEHMSSMLHAGFFSTLFDNFKPALKFALFRIIAMLIYNIVVFAIIAALFFIFIEMIGMFALTVIMAVIFVSIALRLTLTGLVLPIMICENKGPMEAFKISFKYFNVEDMFNRFFSYLIVSVVVYVVVVLSGIVSFNLSYILTIPLSGIIFKALRFVDYYTVKCKKYYITFDEIVIPKELRQNDEQLLNKVDI